MSLNANADLTQLRSLEDYQEGLMKTDDNIIYLGTLDNKRSNTSYLRDDQVISYVKKRTDYKGKVLWPEGRGCQWTYARNQAFMLGGIEARKTFILMTPTEHYRKEYITGTIDELLWLHDNGYRFDKGKDDTLICTPAQSVIPVIKNYHNGEGIFASSKMNAIKNIIMRFESSRSFTPKFEGSAKKEKAEVKIIDEMGKLSISSLKKSEVGGDGFVTVKYGKGNKVA